MKSSIKKLEYNKLYREKNIVSIRQKQKERRREYKTIVFNHYGNACNHCGFDDIRALQIDHIHNNGAEERKALGGQQVSGWRFYKHLIDMGLPIGYQTLCANCNNIKQWNCNNTEI